MTARTDNSVRGRASSIAGISAPEISVSAARGDILPRLDATKLQRHLPQTQRIRIEINGVLAGTPTAVPDAVTELAVGWAFMHRFFSDAGQLGKISATASHVSMMIESGVDLDRAKYEAIGWIPRRDVEIEQVANRSSRSPKAVPVMTEMDAVATCRHTFMRFDEDGAKAGYMHVALSTSNDVACLARDVSSISATQKILGWALSTQADCSASILVVRGILDDMIVEAAGRAGIPLIATDAVPTVEAVARAASSCTSILGLALSHRRGLFTDGGHLGDDRRILGDAIDDEPGEPNA